nr:MAG TPA: hypothetical protein [Caudoviricetes sp.]
MVHGAGCKIRKKIFRGAEPQGSVSRTDRFRLAIGRPFFMPGWRWEFAEAEKIQADKIQGKGQPL